MKRFLSSVGGLALAFAAVFCTMGALISAYSFSVDAATLLWCCLPAALALTSLAALWRGRGILLLAPFAVALIIWKLPEITDGAKWALSFITGEFNKWINVPALFPEAELDAHSLTIFFAAAGICLEFLLSFAICVRRSTPLTILFTAPIVSLTFVLTTHQPNRWFLLGLLAVYLTSLLSGAVYPDDFQKRGLAVFPALALSMLFLSITYVIAPADRDMRGALIDTIDNRIRFAVAQTGFMRFNFGAGWPETNPDVWSFNTNRVIVSDAGPRAITDRSMLEVTSVRAGTYYLRGYSMQLFDGRMWYSNADTSSNLEERFAKALTASIVLLHDVVYPERSSAFESMTIARTGDASGLIYLPYFSLAHNNREPNTVFFNSLNDNILSYYRDLPQSLIEEELAFQMSQMQGLAFRLRSTYANIEESTAEELRRLAIEAGVDPGANRAAVADSVAAYISSAARYTLTPYPIPSGEDFALYFLETSKQGYCIHFATAATLMLRSLDVPARFTSGFVVTVPYENADEPVIVTDRHAHAWVEVYYDDIGWVPLEVTPPGAGIPVGRPHTPASGSSWGADYYEELYPEWMMGLDSSSSPSPSAEPGAGSALQENPDAMTKERIAFSTLPFAAICILFLIARRFIVLRYRKKRFSQEDTNEAVIYIWRCITRLSRSNPPPKNIEDIALKARFSQHRISTGERYEMLTYASKLSEGLCQKANLPKRLWLKFILLY